MPSLRTRARPSRFAARIALAGLAVAAVMPQSAEAHGRLHSPTPRTSSDYQLWNVGPAPTPCAEFPDPGPITARFTAGESIDVTVDVTLEHVTGDLVHFQLCRTPDALSESCFEKGPIASFVDDGKPGLHTYALQLPEEPCPHCVLRWAWEYGFQSCADVVIRAVPEPGAAGGVAALLAVALSRSRRGGPRVHRSRRLRPRP